MKSCVASMAGTVIRVEVKVGDNVSAGQDVVILESMKMEVPVTVESTGIVKAIKVQAGDFVNEGDLLL
ncbi:MAG: acetyl-CoA carboxylase biotin carboxyl carrier protein subunit, partial [Bacilli bacterium]